MAKNEAPVGSWLAVEGRESAGRSNSELGGASSAGLDNWPGGALGGTLVDQLVRKEGLEARIGGGPMDTLAYRMGLDLLWNRGKGNNVYD